MYKYEDYRAQVFLEENQEQFLKARDKAHKLLETSKYIDLDQIIQGLGGGNFLNIAFVDRLVELGDLYEVQNIPGRLRIFMKP